MMFELTASSAEGFQGGSDSGSVVKRMDQESSRVEEAGHLSAG